MRYLFPLAVLLSVACAPGCKTKSSAEQQASSQKTNSAATAKAGELAPIPEQQVAEVTNPKGLKPYSGPTGAVSGVVRLTGDAVPELPALKSDLPRGKCLGALRMYGDLVREGKNRVVADALVAVTGYSGYVPPPSMSRQVTQSDCAFERRTVAMTFGQTLKVRNKGPEASTPQLIGAATTTVLVAVPGGEPISLVAPKPGRYRLVDRSHPFATADVFVLAYPTTDVTDERGQFEIKGIPMGEVDLNVLLPRTGQSLNRTVRIEAGETARLELELPFDEDKHVPKPASKIESRR